MRGFAQMRIQKDVVGAATVVGVLLGAALAAATYWRRPARALLTRSKDAALDAAGFAREKAGETLQGIRGAGEKLQDKAEAAFEDTDRRPYEERTAKELYSLAAEREIAGRSGMSKAELIEALRTQ